MVQSKSLRKSLTVPFNSSSEGYDATIKKIIDAYHCRCCTALTVEFHHFRSIDIGSELTLEKSVFDICELTPDLSYPNPDASRNTTVTDTLFQKISLY